MKHPWVPVAVMMLAALALRLPGLDASFRFDELHSMYVTQMPFRHLLGFFVLHDANMATYFMLLNGWQRLGTSEPFVRALSLLISLLTLPVVFLLARRLWNQEVALTTVWLLTINLFHIRYSQEARSYCLLVPVLCLSSLALLQALEQPTRRNWWLYTASAALAIFTHLFALLSIAAHGMSLLGRPVRVWRGYLWTLIRLAPICVGVALCWLYHNIQLENWVPPTTPATPVLVLVLLCGSVPVGVAFALLLAATWRRPAASEIQVAWWFAFPILLLTVVSLFHPFLVARYCIGSVVPLLTLVAAAFQRVPGRLRVLALAGLSVLCVGSHHIEYDFEDWRGAAAFVTAAAQPGDGMWIYPSWAQFPYRMYQGLHHQSAAPPVVLNPPPPPSGPVPLRTDTLMSIPPDRPHLFLLSYRPDYLGYPDLSPVSSHYIFQQQQDFLGMQVTVWKHRD